MRAQIPLIGFVLIVLTIGVQAQGTQPSPSLGDEQVRRIVTMALDSIPRARCENAQPCAPATAEERANPPVTMAEGRFIIQRGILSAGGHICGLDWQKQNFLPMMAYWRNTMKKNERQMAMIGLVHGIAQGLGMGRPDQQIECTSQMRENIVRQLPFRQ